MPNKELGPEPTTVPERIASAAMEAVHKEAAEQNVQVESAVVLVRLRDHDGPDAGSGMFFNGDNPPEARELVGELLAFAQQTADNLGLSLVIGNRDDYVRKPRRRRR